MYGDILTVRLRFNSIMAWHHCTLQIFIHLIFKSNMSTSENFNIHYFQTATQTLSQFTSPNRTIEMEGLEVLNWKIIEPYFLLVYEMFRFGNHLTIVEKVPVCRYTLEPLLPKLHACTTYLLRVKYLHIKHWSRYLINMTHLITHLSMWGTRGFLKA